MKERKGFYRVGDGVPRFQVLDHGEGGVTPEIHTVVEIFPVPTTPEEMKKLMDHWTTEYILKNRSVGMVTGRNLLDDPKYEGHADPDKVYFLES